MDIGFETIIYIVLGLIFVFAQVAKKKKKEAEAQARGNQDDELSDTRPEPTILEQLLGIPALRPDVDKPVDNDSYPEDDLDPLFPQPGPRESIVGSVNEALARNAVKKNVLKSKTGRKGKSAKRSDFDLRKAVIYQAILERKNF